MVTFRLTRSQRAAAATSSHNSNAPNNDSTDNGNTLRGRQQQQAQPQPQPQPQRRGQRDRDAAPYSRIETSINQFAGLRDSNSSASSSSNGGGTSEENRRESPSGSNSIVPRLGLNHSSSNTHSGKRSTAASASSSTRGRVLRLLDSPRRRILGKMSTNSNSFSALPSSSAGNTNSASALASASDPMDNEGGGKSPQKQANLSASPTHQHFQLRGADDICTGQEDKNDDQKIPAIAAVDVPANHEPFGNNSRSYPIQETTVTDSLYSTPAIKNASASLKSASLYPPGSVQAKYADPSTILDWLHDEAPQDILPRVLSFAGSRKIAALSRASKSWRAQCLSETVWQTACEDTGKYRPGVDPPLTPSTTWLQHYRDNPLVPTDYDTIQAAFYKRHTSVRTGRPHWERTDPSNRHPSVPEHHRSLRVLLKPKTYVLRDALVVHALGRAEVTIETVDGPMERKMAAAAVGTMPMEIDGRNAARSMSERAPATSNSTTAVAAVASDAAASSTPSSSSSSASTSNSSSTTSTKRRLIDLLSCRSTPVLGGDGNEDGEATPGNSSSNNEESESSSEEEQESAAPICVRSRASSMTTLPQDPDLDRSGAYPKYAKRRAVLVLKTKTPNQPIIRVRQGVLRLKDIDFVHNAPGVDIWNGNTAVQVQPPLDDRGDFAVEATSAPNVTATAFVDSCDITSLSGRGLVTIDGGLATVTNSHVHHCAATGIYIGGPGSKATIDKTDVVNNGFGNTRSRRGIARGHSGVYLEQGKATLRDCNISSNALTGISAVSANNATLDIRDSDLMSNVSHQLEMPPPGSVSERRSISRDNRIVNEGVARSRSGLIPPPEDAHMLAEVASPGTRYDEAARTLRSPDRPQSPASDINDGSPDNNWFSN